MQISKLRLSGFKSFVQPTELFIEAGLTGIVGPNGCGKSNLVDALRWVMGESSAKGLRGGEMDDVIFAGTNARAPFDLAEVALHLQAGDEPIPGFENEDEIELTRRIGRGMGSVYRVNGAETRAKDVQLLFADAASGARSASIVSQGRIGALVEAKPMERRKLLEEAAGIGGLQARRHEAELKLQAAETNLVRVEDLLVTLDEQFATLQKQAKQAERYRKLQQSHRETEAALLLGRWQVALAEKSRAEEALRTGKTHVSVYANRLAEARQNRERSQSRLDGLRQEEAVAATENVRLGERLSAVEAEAARLDANQTRLREQERQTVQDLNHAEAGLRDAEAMIDKLKGERQAVLELIEQGDKHRLMAAEAEAETRQALEAAETQFRNCLSVKLEAEARSRQVETSAGALIDRQRALEATRRDLDQRVLGLAEAPGATFERPNEHQGASTPTVEHLETMLAEAMAASNAADERLAQAEAKKQDAEGVLSQAREAERQAESALRQEEEQRRSDDHAKNTLSEREQELSQRVARSTERRKELVQKAEERKQERAALDLEAGEKRLEELSASIEAIAEKQSLAEDQRAADLQKVDLAEQHLTERQHVLGRLEAEAAALDDLVDKDQIGSALLDQVTIDDGYADALAAALGDDLLGSDDPNAPTFWLEAIGASPLDGPSLPAGCVSLGTKVVGPRALARRLAQVGLADHDNADRLQAQLQLGQRLVSREGGLWRWDGLVRKPDGARKAAARLKQQNRRRELDIELAAASKERDQAVAMLEGARRSLEATDTAMDILKTEREAQALTVEAARHALAEIRSKEAALAAELGPLGEEADRLAAELDDLNEQAGAIAEQRKAVADRERDDKDLTALRNALDEASKHLDAAKAANQLANDEQSAARNDSALTRRTVSAAQADLEQKRAKEREEAALMQARAVERAQIETKLQGLDEDDAALSEEISKEGALQEEAKAAEQQATKALADVEAMLERTRERHAQAKAEDTNLRDRHATANRQAETLGNDLEGWNARIEAARSQVDALVTRRKQLVGELADLEDLPADLTRQRTALQAKVRELETKRQAIAEGLRDAEEGLVEAESALQKIEQEQVEARESGARLEAHLERAQAESEAAEQAVRAKLGEGIETGVGEPPTIETLADLETKLARIEASRERLGAVNLRAIDEAAELELRIQTLTSEKDELIQAIERLRRAISALNREGRERLRAAFGEVEKHFESLFVRLFGGGRAKIELTDMDDPLNAGLELAASPPGKKLQSLSLLSGGEKALTAVALIFAIFLTRPSPLCLLDEVDAPLDDANVNRLGILLEELTQATKTRFIVVTHHPLTMARMDRLYGVTMMERGVSQLVGVDLRTAEELRATA